MTLQEWKDLQRGDKIRYANKSEVWEVDHPVNTSTKKQMMNKYDVLDENSNVVGTTAEHCPGGGGNCVSDAACIIASMIHPVGRGPAENRYSNTFSDYQNWVKIV